MVPLFLALGVWLLLVSLAAFFIVKNMPVEEVAVAQPQKVAQAVAVPISDEVFVQRLEAIVKSYAKKRLMGGGRQDKVRRVQAKKKKAVLDNLLPLEMSFYFNNSVKGDGAFARNLDEFLETLKEMPQEVVDFHMREDVNDFEDWLRNVVKDMELADELKKIKESEGPAKEKIIKAIEKRMKQKKLVLKNVPRRPRAL